jgi:hypothetical protein
MHVNTSQPQHPVAKAAQQAAAKLLGIQWHTIRGEARPDDAVALVRDLEMLCRIVDPIVAAFGEYAQSEFGGIDLTLFTDQLDKALQGNATYEIESAGEQLAEDMREFV